jgi:hypothetical protein
MILKFRLFKVKYIAFNNSRGIFISINKEKCHGTVRRLVIEDHFKIFHKEIKILINLKVLLQQA